ncbi:MAG: conjugal transfer protein TraG [Clostridiales bacterium]|nr:MAG: conjugal transfer protein TraG [Clostridiales bacterium]
MLFVCAVPVIIWLALIIAGCYEQDIKLFELIDRLTVAVNNPTHIIFNEYSLKAVLIFLFLYAMGIGVYFSSRENRRPGEEHGSAKWGNVKSIVRRYADKNNLSNIILSQNMRLGLNAKKHRRNLNVLVVGGSGAGKTRFYAKPNLMQCNTSFIVADPKGEMLRSIAPLLIEKGYDIKVFNLIEPENSDGYNPFVYIRKDEDVIRLISNLIQNTTPKNAQQNDPFWEKSEIALDSALMLYLLHEAPPEEQTFEMLMFLIENAATVEDDEDGYQSPVDILFNGLEEEKPEHIAVKQYKIFKQASGKTAKSILISAAVRLAAFNLPEIAKMTSYDNLDIGSLGDRKRAIFCVIPDNDNSFNYLVGMLYTQAFQALYYNADHKHGGELPVPVHIVMDEFANVALPDNFERILATMRSRRISVSIIIQNMAQLKALFKDSWENITGNCDTLLYLGGNEQSTHEYISKMLGKETIDTRTRGITKGQHGSSNTNYQNAGRELLTLDEVRLLDNSNALIFIRGERPLIDKKFDILSHPNISKTADGKAIPYKHSKSGKYLRSDLSFTIKEDLSNIKILEVDGDNVKSIDLVNPQEQKPKENSEVSDNEKSEHKENNDKNRKNTEYTEEN